MEQSSAVQGTGADAPWLSVLPPNHLLELCCGLVPGLAAGATTFVAPTIVPGELCSPLLSCRVTQMVVVLLMPGSSAATSRVRETSTWFSPGHLLRRCAARSGDRHVLRPAGHRRVPGIRPVRGSAGRVDEQPRRQPCRLGRPSPARHSCRIGGRLRTGDVGRLDDDGYFRHRQSQKSDRPQSGEKVQPEEVEVVLVRGDRFGGVCVVGWRPTGGPYGGERVGAVVVPVEPMSEDEVIEKVRW